MRDSRSLGFKVPIGLQNSELRSERDNMDVWDCPGVQGRYQDEKAKTASSGTSGIWNLQSRNIHIGYDTQVPPGP